MEKEIKVDVWVTLGSEFQTETVVKMIQATLVALKAQIESQHKGNKFDYTVEEATK